jgi:2-polyprenyl-6-methoxyphenol hydroxylase-like FAD-dependent oxidoreductase
MPLALIVGAGIGGLAAGIALRRAGWDIRIFERAEAPREVGFGVGLAPNALAALRELGVADAVLPHLWIPNAGELRHPDGRVIRRLIGPPREGPIAAKPATAWSTDLPGLIMRPMLHGALLDAVGIRVIEVNREASRVRIDDRRAHLTFTSGETASGDIVVGADGFGSVVRAQLHPGEPPARPSGYFALRGASKALDRLGDLEAIWYLGRGIESAIVRCGPEGIYWFLSLLADDVRGGPLDPHGVRRRFGARFDAQFDAITSASVDMRLDELFERDPLTAWGKGPATLLGDAAHPMLPHTGQGAAQALEDAAGLGRAVWNIADPIAALRCYEAVRARRANPIVRSGPRIAKITTTRSRVVAAARNAGIRVVPRAFIVTALTRPAGDPNRALGGPPGGDHVMPRAASKPAK